MSTPQYPDDSGDSAANQAVHANPNAPKSTPAERFRDHAATKQTDRDEVDAETTLWEGGYSPQAMIGTWALLALVSVALIVASTFIDAFTLPIAIGIVAVIWVLGAVVYFFRRIGVGYQLTTQRFIHQNGVFTRRTDRIEVIDIDDVSYTQGPVQRMLGVGTIRLTGSDRTHPELVMVGIGDVASVAGLIDDTRRKERRRRSLHIESV